MAAPILLAALRPSATMDAEKESSSSKEEAPPVKQPGFLSRLSKEVPWIEENLKSSKSWKKFFKCLLASWIALIMILPNATAGVMGQAGFFAFLASIFLPPMMPAQLFLVVLSTMILGLLIGWGFGAAAIRAAVAVRDPVELQAAYVTLQQALANSTNPALTQQSLLFGGLFLDTRASVIFGVFLGISTFLFALVRAYSPKLTLLSIFGTIAVDVFCTFGVFFPTANYTLLNSFLISTGIYAGIATVIIFAVFPETMNHMCMEGFAGIVMGTKGLLDKQDEVLASKVSDLHEDAPLLQQIQGTRAKVIGGIRALMAASGLINVEVTWGKWNGDDVKALEKPLLSLVARIASLQSFVTLVGIPTTQASPSSSGETLASPQGLDGHLIRQLYLHNKASESRHSLSIEDLMPVIDEATKDLRKACSAALAAIYKSLTEINAFSFSTNTALFKENNDELKASMESLEAAVNDFEATKRRKLVEPYLPLLQSATSEDLKASLPLRSLYLAYSFSAVLLTVSISTIDLIKLIHATEERRQKRRLWLPKGLRALRKLFTKPEKSEEDAVFGEDRQTLAVHTAYGAKKYARDPDSRPPNTVLQKMSSKIYGLYHWSQTTEAIFVFKYTILSIALFLPACFKSTAEFYYIQKGLWALIMAQTTLNLYASEMILNLIIRIGGTFIGLIIGLLAWYTGNGNGPGNPYGMAAAGALFIAPLLWLRLYIPPTYAPGVLLCGATVGLIIGYSWIDNHLGSYGNPGYGWSIAWKRFVLVIIGSAASAIMMLWSPRSARRAVRVRNAGIINSIAEIYGDLVGCWISSDKIPQDDSDDGEVVDEKITGPRKSPPWMQDFRDKLTTLATEITALQEVTSVARWEGNLRGEWPYELYARLEKVEQRTLTGLAQLGGALAQLDIKWRRRFLQVTHAIHPNFIGDVMAMFSLVSQSLITGTPMHQSLPSTLIDRLIYHKNAAQTSEDIGAPNALAEIDSVDFMYYATGLIGAHTVLMSLDEMHAITRELCGEIPMNNYAEWQLEHFERHKSRV